MRTSPELPFLAQRASDAACVFSRSPHADTLIWWFEAEVRYAEEEGSVVLSTLGISSNENKYVAMHMNAIVLYLRREYIEFPYPILGPRPRN